MSKILTPAKLRRPLLDWYDENGRDLPWRRSSDPYVIWVSEIMAQQTRIDTVIPYWHRFLERFPTIAALATAPLDDVLALWAGLGYYARARNMHRAAQIVVEQHAGALPQTEKELSALPGLGRYTVGAIRSMAFGQRAPLVDGNVGRVLSRLFLVNEAKDYWRLAEEAVDPARPGDFNQALMELGAIVCTPKEPSCAGCPLRRSCGASSQGLQAQFPAKKAPPKRSRRRTVCALVVRRGRVLLAKRPPTGLLGGMWELPSSSAPQAALARVSLEVGSAVELGEVEHTFTHIDMTYTAYRCTAKGRARPLAGDDYQAVAWVAPDDLPEFGTGKATRRMLAAWLPTG